MALYEFDGKRPRMPQQGDIWVAPSADLIGDIRLQSGVSVWFGAVIRADNTPIEIGAGTNIQEGSLLHSDPDSPLSIGGDVTVGHHAILHGCIIGNRVLIGMGAIILNNARIPDDCIVGAGALVTDSKDFPPASLILGVPARATRPLSLVEIATIKTSGQIYREKAVHYASSLRKIETGQ